MSTFHPFPRLPTELRLQIWEMTVEPRTVEGRILFTDFPSTPLVEGRQERPPRQTSTLHSPTPVPSPLQTCREARHHGLYKQALSDLVIDKRVPNPERPYVWLNPEIDIVSIDDTDASLFKSVAHEIQRLKFAKHSREGDGQVWTGWQFEQFRCFTHLKEIYVDIGYNDFEYWQGASKMYWWCCGAENAWLIQARDEQMMKLEDLETSMIGRRSWSWRKRRGGFYR